MKLKSNSLLIKSLNKFFKKKPESSCELIKQCLIGSVFLTLFSIYSIFVVSIVLSPICLFFIDELDGKLYKFSYSGLVFDGCMLLALVLVCVTKTKLIRQLIQSIKDKTCFKIEYEE